MSGFHEVRFPDDIAYGAVGGPGYSTTIAEAVSGHEHRNANWQQARGRWNIGTGIRNRQQWEEVIAFFRARKGRAYGFRFRDWSDFKAVAAPIGTGDGTTTDFQLIKRYGSGGVYEDRIITKPVTGTVKIYLDGTEQTSGWSVDTTTGVVTFTTAPANGVAITADFEFDVPVRFDTDHLTLSIETFEHGQWADIPIVEIRT